jgi:hypothetical protein
MKPARSSSPRSPCGAIIIILGYRDHEGGFKAEKTPSFDGLLSSSINLLAG